MSDHTHGSSGGVELTEDAIERLVDEAEQGFEPERLRNGRRRGRPPLGDAPARVFQVRLEPELREALEDRAEAEGATPSSLAREALRRFLFDAPASATTGERES